MLLESLTGARSLKRLSSTTQPRFAVLILADTVSEVGTELRIVVESWIDPARSADAMGFFNATVPWNFSPQFIRANPALLEDAKKRYALLDFPAVVRLCECFLGVNFSERLREIKVPTCILVGERDLIKGPTYAEILHRNIPHAELHVVRESGHAICWERAKEFQYDHPGLPGPAQWLGDSG